MLLNLVKDKKTKKTGNKKGKNSDMLIKKLTINKKIAKLFKFKILDKIIEKIDKIKNHKKPSFLTSKIRLTFIQLR